MRQTEADRMENFGREQTMRHRPHERKMNDTSAAPTARRHENDRSHHRTLAPHRGSSSGRRARCAASADAGRQHSGRPRTKQNRRAHGAGAQTLAPAQEHRCMHRSRTVCHGSFLLPPRRLTCRRRDLCTRTATRPCNDILPKQDARRLARHMLDKRQGGIGRP